MTEDILKQSQQLAQEIENLENLQQHLKEGMKEKGTHELRLYMHGANGRSDLSGHQIATALGDEELKKLTKIFTLILQGTAGELLLEKQLKFLAL